MKIERVELIQVRMPLVHFFETSFGREFEREALLVAVTADGVTGWGECPASAAPAYSYETVQTAWHILRDFLVPRVKGLEIAEAGPLASTFSFVRGHPMAKAGVEMAVLDWFGKTTGRPIGTLLGGIRKEIPTGISLGIEDRLSDLLTRVEKALECGYRRIKVKIKPGWDIDVVAETRKRFPSISLMVDANSAYRMSDSAHLRKLDEFQLMMIEQPLDYDDMVDHARLQKELKTAICLDESIKSPEDGRRAIELGSCRVVNIKQARVGGPFAAKTLHDVCNARGVPVWCGGLLETGIGRAHNIALATLANFTLPGDISASERYYREDLIDPPVTVTAQGTIKVPTRPGIGYTVVESRVAKVAVRREVVPT